MPSLQTVADTTEEELIALIQQAWGVSKVHTSPPEIETALSALPEALLFLQMAEPSEEGEGSLCSESAALVWYVLYHAKKPASGQLATARRARAQEIRSAVAGASLTYAQLVRWQGDDYNEPDDLELQATQQSYAVRVRFTTFVEWQD